MKPAEYRTDRDPGRDCFKSVLFWSSVLFLAAFVGQCSSKAHAGPYALVNGGPMWAEQQSNSDEIEFGSEANGAVGVEGGWAWDLDLATVSLGAEAAHHWKDLHGANGSDCTTQRSCTADGETLHLTTVTINARAERVLYWRLGVYGMVGAGGGYADGLGDSDVVPFVQGEAGVMVEISDSVTAGAGFRASRAFDVCLDSNCGSLDFRGPVVWGRMELW